MKPGSCRPTPGASPLRLVARRVAASLLVGSTVFAGPAAASEATTAGTVAPAELTRHEVISYFLLNCLRFASWPEAADPRISKALRIGLVAADDLERPLKTLADEAMTRWYGGGSVTIVRSKDPKELSGSHIVFVGRQRASNLAATLTELEALPVVLVGEQKGFLEAGGVAEINISRGAFTFSLNLDQLSARGIDIASKMKDLAATIVMDGHRGANPRRRRP